ncbi:MAG: cadherin-like beta sandwich domain-containing protein [Eubacteriales bacterium]|nr:cadherin-like beta sandwich domain-containing protein [Eubacteriales bacterium]
MKIRKNMWKCMLVFAIAILCVFGMTATAEYLSGDNSLYSLGLENGKEDPEFYYSTLDYDVTVPAGTTELELDPILSDPDATILAVEGTQLDDNGSGTVEITVQAPNGAQVTYTLHVKAEGAAEAAVTESETEKATEDAAAKAQEQARLQAESEAAMRDQANQEKIEKLNAEVDTLNTRLDLILKICYGLIAFAVILLFFIINQSLRNKDLKDEVKEARAEAGDSYEFARKAQTLRSDYYYAPVQGTPQNSMAGMNQGAPVHDFGNVQNVYTSAPQQMMQQPAAETAVQQEAPLSRREQKKAEKAARKAAKSAPAPAPQQAAPMVDESAVRSNVPEQDVNVDMIDL